VVSGTALGAQIEEKGDKHRFGAWAAGKGVRHRFGVWFRKR